MYGIFAWLNLLTSRTNLSASNFKWILGYCAFYTWLNWYCTKVNGRPIYQPIDWKSYKSAVFLGAAFSLALIGFYIALKVSQGMNRVFQFVPLSKIIVDSNSDSKIDYTKSARQSESRDYDNSRDSARASTYQSARPQPSSSRHY